MIIQCPYPDCTFEVGEDVPDDCKNTLLQLHLQHHQSKNAYPTQVEKIKRPSLSVENTTEDWNYFVSRWENYKRATGLTEPNITGQLMECCDESLRKDLTRVHRSSLYSLNEIDLLKAIRHLAVQEESTLVSRYKLHGMKQDMNEPIRTFSARLRGQANVCKLVVTCPSCKFPEVDFSNEIIKDTITRGIHDEDIRLNLLSDRSQDMGLDKILAYIEA